MRKYSITERKSARGIWDLLHTILYFSPNIKTDLNQSKGHIMRITCVVFFLLFIQVSVIAQPEKFGRISSEDWELTPEELEHEAIVLFDYGELRVEDDLQYKYVRHWRIKINNDAALAYANIRLRYNYEDEGQEYKKIEAFSYNLDERGKVQKTKLGKDNLFEEDYVGNWKDIKVTIPNVREGSIIDFRFEKILGGPYQLPNWYFHEEIPVKWSEFVAEIPVYLRFSLIQNLNKEPDVQEVKSTKSSISYNTSVNSSGYGGSRGQKLRLASPAEEFRWVLKDLPALEEEPYIRSIENYRSFIFLQYKGISIPEYEINDTYTESWDSFAEEVEESPRVGGAIKAEPWSIQLAEELTRGMASDLEKIERIFEYITEFDKEEGDFSFSYEDLREVNENRSGNRTSLNVLFIKLLRSIGIFADPVFISTRDNGEILKEYVLSDQFNKIISRVTINNTVHFLDSSSPISNVLLPMENINGDGLVILNGRGIWAKVENSYRTSSSIDVRAELKENGSVSGSFQAQFEGYDAITYLQLYEQDSLAAQRVISFFDEDVEIDSLVISYPTFTQPKVEIEGRFELLDPNEDQIGELFYIRPIGFEYLNLTQFQSTPRKYPIEFPFAARRTLSFKMTLPDGYEPDDLPESTTITIPGKRFNYTDSFFNLSSGLSIERKLITLDTNFDLNDYGKVKSVIEAAGAETPTIVIKKIAK